MKRNLLAIAAAGILSIVAGQATAVSTITLNDVGEGWINQSGTGNGNSQNNNYFAGNCNVPTGCTTLGGEYRNFFQFSIPTLAGAVELATLVLDTSLVAVGQSPTMDLTLTSTSGLTFAQLGNGTLYATRTYSLSDQGTLVSIALNAAALSDISADTGGTFTISGRISSGAAFGPSLPSQDIFGQSISLNQLSITIVPEPGTLLLLGFGFVGLAAVGIRRRRV